METFRIIESPEQPTVAVRERVRMVALPAFFDRALPEAMAAIQSAGGQPAGPPFALYHGMPTDSVDIEVGFPVAAPVATAAAETGATASTLPGGRVATCTHVGPYDQLPETYGNLIAWMEQQGHRPGESMWEVYLSDPGQEPDQSKWRTGLFWPVDGTKE